MIFQNCGDGFEGATEDELASLIEMDDVDTSAAQYYVGVYDGDEYMRLKITGVQRTVDTNGNPVGCSVRYKAKIKTTKRNKYDIGLYLDGDSRGQQGPSSSAPHETSWNGSIRCQGHFMGSNPVPGRTYHFSLDVRLNGKKSGRTTIRWRMPTTNNDNNTGAPSQLIPNKLYRRYGWNVRFTGTRVCQISSNRVDFPGIINLDEGNYPLERIRIGPYFKVLYTLSDEERKCQVSD